MRRTGGALGPQSRQSARRGKRPPDRGLQARRRPASRCRVLPASRAHPQPRLLVAATADLALAPAAVIGSEVPLGGSGAEPERPGPRRRCRTPTTPPSTPGSPTATRAWSNRSTPDRPSAPASPPPSSTRRSTPTARRRSAPSSGGSRRVPRRPPPTRGGPLRPHRSRPVQRTPGKSLRRRPPVRLRSRPNPAVRSPRVGSRPPTMDGYAGSAHTAGGRGHRSGPGGVPFRAPSGGQPGLAGDAAGSSSLPSPAAPPRPGTLRRECEMRRPVRSTQVIL